MCYLGLPGSWVVVGLARALACLFVPARAGVCIHDWPVDKLGGLEEWRDMLAPKTECMCPAVLA